MLAASIHLAHGEVTAGTDVFSSDDPGQPCGIIVNAERSSPDQVNCLVSLRIPVPDGVTVHFGSASGPLLRFEPLPYSLPDDSARS